MDSLCWKQSESFRDVSRLTRLCIRLRRGKSSSWIGFGERADRTLRTIGAAATPLRTTHGEVAVAPLKTVRDERTSLSPKPDPPSRASARQGRLVGRELVLCWPAERRLVLAKLLVVKKPLGAEGSRRVIARNCRCQLGNRGPMLWDCSSKIIDSVRSHSFQIAECDYCVGKASIAEPV